MSPDTQIRACDDYLMARTGNYGYRRIRYSAAANAMIHNGGLTNSDTVVDVGAGWTELDYCLRTEFDWRGRYMPIDGSLDGVDLNYWSPPRDVEWFVALEIVEHVYDPCRLIQAMQERALKGVIISTPNPETTDVFGMDPTHVVEVYASTLREMQFAVQPRSFYGEPKDSLFAVFARIL